MGLRKSFLALLGREEAETTDTSDAVLEHIRLAMLSAIEVHCDTQDIAVYKPIRYARDLSALWFMRPHLMQAIAASRSEAIAIEVLHQITDLFKGHLASANASRFGSL
ncbi:hypothetical protein [Rhodoferax lacus]|uniref:hypothetical protein n=1 Tax=Rhodoferax lacus TaxID=2184758 RepID=UPI0011C1B889|nr:hypothetical protein [Rhodoferax lacus]